jgi:hypothetical protein
MPLLLAFEVGGQLRGNAAGRNRKPRSNDTNAGPSAAMGLFNGQLPDFFSGVTTELRALR